MKEKLIIALDVETADKALRLVDTLHRHAGMFKIGAQLFTAAGPELVHRLVSQGVKIFLDLKFHDIPNTVAAACIEATRLGVSIVNLHALGGSVVMSRAAEAVMKFAAKEGVPRPAVIAVTVLTSADAGTLHEVGIISDPKWSATNLARLAAGSGLDGVVSSAHEIAAIRNAVAGSGVTDFIVVTPGVRPKLTDTHDQLRVVTPAAAITAGADYIVVGRAIINADDPSAAAQEIVAEMENEHL
ncbi:MAG: orotidine-5'-phosphate decarboxylase [Pyrinomonadaceae bacterium]